MSPGRKQELSEIDKILLSIGVDVGQATQTGSGGSESEKSKVRDYASQWDFEDSKRARSLSGLPPASISKAVQAERLQCNARDRSTQTSHGKNNKSVCVQAFEEDPWAGLLSRQEVCDMIKVDNLVGLGYKERPQARYEDHSVTSKRLIMDGVVYQVIIVKERYVEEQVVTQVIEKPKKETVISKNKEADVIEVIEIEDDRVEEEKEKEVEKEIVEIKEEGGEGGKFEEVSAFKDKP